MQDSHFSSGIECRVGGRRCAWRAGLVLILAITAGGCGPVWVFDPMFGRRIAEDENKPMLLYFRAWDSTQHRDMRLKVFDHPEVKSELANTVNVEVQFGFWPEIDAEYGVRRPQICVMCKPNGEKAGTSRYVNPVPTPEAFLKWLRRVKAEALPKPASRQAPLGAGSSGAPPS